MGSYDFTCGISGLPIGDGKTVRFMLLTQNPYGNRNACYMHDVWFPRTFPIQSNYDSYGGIDTSLADFDKTQIPHTDLWMDCFKLDLHEVGTGDNSCHDVHTSKDMTFSHMLSALAEGRLKVSREFGRNDDLLSKYEREEQGLPTIQKAKAALKKAKLKIYEGNYVDSGYMVDAQGVGIIRIRYHCSSSEWSISQKPSIDRLSKVEKLFGDYATVITNGGNPNGGPELLVFVKAGTKNKDGHPLMSYRERTPDVSDVSQIMILEDVWQELLAGKRSIYDNGKIRRLSIADFRHSVLDFWEECIDRIKLDDLKKLKSNAPSPKELYKIRNGFWMCSKSIAAQWLEKDIIPFSVGWGTHWAMMVWKWVLGGLSVSQRDSFLNSVAEACFVSYSLLPIRFWWKPSHSCGPQMGEYLKHAEFHKSMAKIATRLNRRKYS